MARAKWSLQRSKKKRHPLEVTATGWRPRGVECDAWYGGGPVFPLERVSRSAPTFLSGEAAEGRASPPDAENAERREKRIASSMQLVAAASGSRLAAAVLPDGVARNR
jgi:hypothetical protein